MRLFFPSEMQGHHRACAYISRRLCDFILHRMQQGKQHDHVSIANATMDVSCFAKCAAILQGKFKKVKKAFKRSLAENYTLKTMIEKENIDEDDLFESLMSLYTVDIRKGLISTLLRVLAPYVGRRTFVSEDESVTWKYGGIARLKNKGHPYRVELDEGAVV
tara:strand:- start:54 stop:539 length:486 start_codon:yes stop_codon:yes gene_type:complete